MKKFTYTENEKAVAKFVRKNCDANEDNAGEYNVFMFCHFDVMIALDCCAEAAGGVIASLEKKYAIYDSEHRGEENQICWNLHRCDIEKILA